MKQASTDGRAGNAAAEVADDPGTRAIPRTEKPTIGTSLDQNSMICVRAFRQTDRIDHQLVDGETAWRRHSAQSVMMIFALLKSKGQGRA